MVFVTFKSSSILWEHYANSTVGLVWQFDNFKNLEQMKSTRQFKNEKHLILLEFQLAVCGMPHRLETIEEFFSSVIEDYLIVQVWLDWILKNHPLFMQTY